MHAKYKIGARYTNMQQMHTDIEAASVWKAASSEGIQEGVFPKTPNISHCG